MTQRTILLYLACLAAVLSCSNLMEDNKGGGEPPVLYEETYGEEIGTYYVENRNMTLRLMDITSLYQEVGYMSQAVPVNHVSYQNLPASLKEPVKQYALGAPSQVYRMKWRGETVYHLICPLFDDIIGVYKPSGERIPFSSMEAYLQFLQEVSDVNCLLIINTEVVKSVEGAPNLLEGYWQSDWLHLHHDISSTNSGVQTVHLVGCRLQQALMLRTTLYKSAEPVHQSTLLAATQRAHISILNIVDDVDGKQERDNGSQHHHHACCAPPWFIHVYHPLIRSVFPCVWHH